MFNMVHVGSLLSTANVRLSAKSKGEINNLGVAMIWLGDHGQLQKLDQDWQDCSSVLMADSPDHKLHPCLPFVFVIFNFADSYLTRVLGNRRVFLKLWGLVIICLNKSCQDETGLLLTMATIS